MGVKSVRGFIWLPAAFLSTLISVAPAQSNSPGAGFAMVGIASGESARLNAVNTAPVATANGSSCTVTFQFLDSQGQLLKQTTINLQPGTAGALDFSYEETPGTDLRAEIRGVLLFGYTGGANPPPGILQQTACANLLPSLEVYDEDTGRTSFILTDSKNLPAPATPAQ